MHLDPASSSALTIDDVERVLDTHGPIGVDHDTSSADVGPGPSAEFHIQCSTEPNLNINLIQDGDLFLVEHPSGIDEHYGEPQIDQMLRRLGKVLTATYEIEETYWKGCVVRAVHRQQGVDESSEELEFVLGWLPPPWWPLRRARFETRRRTASFRID
ncbi:hypothetical protein SAMN05421756_11189 [Microlunatus flavus]|uniref:Uncharacterized protein n=1 Tax=Microlunatus flavus TaxID=1036181 RepID=A0A1H9MVT1_9ACTN|nr:hypothetical protein SAMN05421756_11189 [Microlunatus flavus]